MQNFDTETIKKYKCSGSVHFLEDGKWSDFFFGYSDISKKIPNKKDDHINFFLHNKMMTSLALIRVFEEYHLSFNDSLEKYIPEYKHSALIKIKQLISNSIKIPDYYEMKIACSEETKQKLSELSINKQILYNFEKEFVMYNFKDQLDFINSIDEEPLGDESNFTKQILVSKIIEKITGITYEDYLINHFFKSHGIHPAINGPLSRKQYIMFMNKSPMLVRLSKKHLPYLSFTLDELKVFYSSLINGQIIKKSHFDLLRNKKWNYSGASYEDGSFLCFNFYFSGNPIVFFYNPVNKISFITIINNKGISDFKPAVGYDIYNVIYDYLYFSAFRYNNPKFFELKKLEDVDSACCLDINKDQYQFMTNGAVTLAYGKYIKEDKYYIVKDNNIVVGLCKLYVDKKNKDYAITNVIVDSRFQRKGYGKFMIVNACHEMRKFGLKKITIGVDRQNINAYKTYLSAGFKEAEQSAFFITLEKVFE